MGRQIRNSAPSFHAQLKAQWPELDNLRARESVSKLKQETVFNSRHEAKPLPSIRSGTEVSVKDLQRLGKVIEAVSTPWLYKVETSTSTIRRNCVHLTPLPNQQEQHERPTQIVSRRGQSGNTCSERQSKGDILVPPVTPILATKPKTIIKPSLKVR